MEKGEHKEEPAAQTEGEVKGEEKEEEKKEEPKKAQEEEKIRSIVLTGYGGYSKIQIQKSRKPQPTDGRVLIRVHAWWVSHLERWFSCFFFFTIRIAAHFPQECNNLDHIQMNILQKGWNFL